MGVIQFLYGIHHDFKGGNPLALLEYIKYYKYDKMLKMPEIGCNRFYEYCLFYAPLNYKNKVVVDYGADIGSSAIYFLSKGATKVIGIEIDKKAKNISKNLKFNEFNFKNAFAYTTQKHPKGDILKMDIEGAEKDILTKEYLKTFQQFAIGLHPFAYTTYFYNKLEKIILNLGGKRYGMVSSQGKSEIVYIKT